MAKKKHVLYVEDSEKWQRAVGNELRDEYGAKVTIAGNLEDALKLVEKNEYDLYITDGNYPLTKNDFPEDTAWEGFCKAVNKKNSEAQILLLTSDPNLGKKAGKVGAEYIGKTEYKKLDAYLERHLRQKQILLVEDTPDDVRSFKRVVAESRLDVKIVRVNDLAKALKAIQRREYTLYVTDGSYPLEGGRNGIIEVGAWVEFCTAVRKKDKKARIALRTFNPNFEDKAKSMGVTYLNKNHDAELIKYLQQELA